MSEKNEIFVIVENMENHSGGCYLDGEWQDETYECICQHLGYYTDMEAVDKKVQELNDAYVAARRLKEKNPSLAVVEEWETHFGHLPLELVK